MNTVLGWRNNPRAVAAASEILNQPHMRLMIQLLEREHPAFGSTVIKDGFDATMEVGWIRGYQKAISTLRSLGEPLITGPVEVMSTFGSPEEPLEEKQ